MTRSKTINPPYSVLAKVYDEVMKEVDYEVWGDYIDEIMQTHHPDPTRILELGCGTGSLSLSLDELMCYEIVGTDKSAEMIKIARQKARRLPVNHLSFRVADFLDLTPLYGQTFDVALLTFDGVNYLQDSSEILQLLREVRKVLEPGGMFIFDFTTPRNSAEAIEMLDGEEGSYKDFHYRRSSHYDDEEQIHTNVFIIRHVEPDTGRVLDCWKEVHRQRIYSLAEMESIINESSFKILSKYEDFTLEEADPTSLRVTLTLQCPQT